MHGEKTVSVKNEEKKKKHTIFHSGNKWSAPIHSTNVANPSFSQRSSHHFIVTRLPNHWKKEQPSTVIQCLFVREKYLRGLREPPDHNYFSLGTSSQISNANYLNLDNLHFDWENNSPKTGSFPKSAKESHRK